MFLKCNYESPRVILKVTDSQIILSYFQQDNLSGHMFHFELRKNRLPILLSLRAWGDLDAPCNVYEGLSLPEILVFNNVSCDYHAAERKQKQIWSECRSRERSDKVVSPKSVYMSYKLNWPLISLPVFSALVIQETKESTTHTHCWSHFP